MKFDVNSKKSKNKRNYKQAMDLNVDRYGQSATQDNFAFTKTKMKKESAFKMKGFTGFGNSPAKFDPSKDLRAKANIDGKFQDARNLAKPKFDPAKHVVDFKKGVAYTPKGKVKVNVDKISKKPASYASKVFKGFKNLAKGIGGRATGIAGMMMATTGTALGSNKSLKSQEGAARRLYNKRKKK